jgi:hypothetical protein
VFDLLTKVPIAKSQSILRLAGARNPKVLFGFFEKHGKPPPGYPQGSGSEWAAKDGLSVEATSQPKKLGLALELPRICCLKTLC